MGKVQYYVRQYYQYSCLLFFFLVGMYTDLSVQEHQNTNGKMTLLEAISDPTSDGAPILLGSRSCLLVSFILAVLFLLREFRQARERETEVYFSDGWNLIELFGYGTVLVTNIWLAAGWDCSNIVSCVSTMILTCMTMVHLRGFERYSPIITTFLQIVSDMRSFVVIVVLLWMGGTIAFKSLLPHRPAFQGFNGFWSTWQMVLGDVMPLSVRFEDADVWREGKEANAEEYARATSMVAQTLSGLFVFVLVVVLMNQLIALMGDSYDRVQENYTVRIRARVIRDMMDLYVPKSDNKLLRGGFTFYAQWTSCSECQPECLGWTFQGCQKDNLESSG